LADDVLGPHNIVPAEVLTARFIPREAPKLCEWAIGLAQDMDHLSVEDKLATSLLTAPLARVTISSPSTLTHDAKCTSGKSPQRSKITTASRLV
jgi:hypothetical protein